MKVTVTVNLILLLTGVTNLINSVLVRQLTLGKGQVLLPLRVPLANCLTHNDALDVPDLLTGKHGEDAKLDTMWQIWVHPSPAPLKQTGEEVEDLQPQSHNV